MAEWIWAYMYANCAPCRPLNIPRPDQMGKFVNGQW